MQIEGSNVLVTGASRGIGEALAREFAAQGARVCVVARSADKLQAVADDIGGTALVADLLDEAQVDGLLDRVTVDFGPVDILVNNAGLDCNGAFLAADPAEIRNTVRLNLETTMVLTRAFVPGMVERGRGHLVFVSSLAGTAGFPSLAAYSGTKAGVNNFTAAMRLELNTTDIGTTLLAPGPIDTDMWDSIEENPYNAAVLRRLRRLQMLPTGTPAKLARRAVAAVAADKRHVRQPRRLLANFWLGEAPRRLTELLLTGVKFDVPK
jgi:short-subunit dehydrogenase